MKRTKNGANLTIEEIYTLGSVVDIIRIEAGKTQPDMNTIKTGTQHLLQCLFAMLPDHIQNHSEEI